MSCDELHILVWFRMSCPSDAGSLTLKHQVMGQRLETAATVPLLQDRGFQKLCPQTKEAGFGAFVVVDAFCSWLLLVLWCWLMLVVVVDKPALIVNLVVCYSTGLYLFCDFSASRCLCGDGSCHTSDFPCANPAVPAILIFQARVLIGFWSTPGLEGVFHKPTGSMDPVFNCFLV